MKLQIIIGISILIMLVGCQQKQELFTNLDEAMKVEFNDSIHQLKKCSISIYSKEEYLSFVFFGDCGHIKRECKEEDVCEWSVSSGASCYKQEECYPDFTGRCVCRFKDS